MASSSEKVLTRNINPFGLRIQPNIKQALEEKAVKAGRSLNMEIASRLEQSLLSEKKTKSTDETIALLLDRVSRLEKRCSK